MTNSTFFSVICPGFKKHLHVRIRSIVFVLRPLCKTCRSALARKGKIHIENSGLISDLWPNT